MTTPLVLVMFHRLPFTNLCRPKFRSGFIGIHDLLTHTTAYLDFTGVPVWFFERPSLT